MKYDFDFMDELVSSTIHDKPKYMKKEHDVSEATYYRWLKKYREGTGASEKVLESTIKKMKVDFEKDLQAQKKDLIEKSNSLLEENMKAYEYYVSSLILVHTDVYLDDLLENTKAIFSPKTLK